MKVINFGSLNFDHVYEVEHFVQPGETITAKNYHRLCGGKGLNQSIALARAGAPVFHAGKVGCDGEALIACLKTQVWIRRTSASSKANRRVMR